MKKQVVAILFLTLLILPFQLTAQMRHKGEAPRHDGPRHEAMMEKLNLTDQQEEQIEKLRSEHKLKMIDVRAEIKKLEVQLNDEKRKTDLDENKILSITKQIGDLRTNLQTQRTEMWLSIYNLLDDRQKELWKEHRPERIVKKERIMKHRRMDF